MKFHSLVVLVFLFSLNCFAGQELLRCNVPFGELQEVVVIKEANQYVLRQLDNTGSFSQYKITAKEWSKKKIKLKLKWQGPADLLFEDGRWVFTSKDGDYLVLICD